MQYHRPIHCSSLDTACTAMYTRKQDTCTARAYKVIVRPASYKYRSLSCILFSTFCTEHFSEHFPYSHQPLQFPPAADIQYSAMSKYKFPDAVVLLNTASSRKVAGVSGLKGVPRDVEDAPPDSSLTRFSGTVYAMLTLPSARSPIAYVIELKSQDKCHLQKLAAGDVGKHSAGQEYIVKYICLLSNACAQRSVGRHRDRQVLNGVGYFKAPDGYHWQFKSTP